MNRIGEKKEAKEEKWVTKKWKEMGERWKITEVKFRAKIAELRWESWKNSQLSASNNSGIDVW